MTKPNLDALAKLGPFTSRSTWGGDEFIGSDGETIDTEVAEAALNEWVELRAYRERTEKALVELSESVDWTQFVKFKMSRLGLWRDPAPKEASDGD